MCGNEPMERHGSSEMSLRFLVVEPDADTRSELRSYVDDHRQDVQLEVVDGASAAIEAVREGSFDCVVSEYGLAEMDGIELYHKIADAAENTPYVLFSSTGPKGVARAAFDAGIDDFVQKRPDESGFEFLLDKVEGVVGRNREPIDDDPGRRPAVEAIAAVFANGEAVWTTGGMDADPEQSADGVDAAIDAVVAAPDAFRTAVARARSNRETVAPLRWPRADAGEIEHWGYPLPDDARFELYRDRTEEATRGTRLKRYERLLDTASDGLYTLDVNGYYRYVNDRFVELTGYDREELLGRHASTLMGEGEYERGQQHVQEVVGDAERESEVLEMSVETKDGEQMPTAIHFSPMYDEDGAYDGLVGVTRDITEQKERERELERQNERLSEFASIVSHDLRNPLTTIEGNLTLYRETGDESRLDAVETQVERMSALVDELLELARQGQRVGAKEDVDLDGLVTECWAGVSTPGIALNRPETLGSVRADRGRLAQVFENLFRNAVEHGGPDVTVTVGRLDDGFYVADDGDGIDPDVQDKLFEYGVSTRENGTGIGLAIVSEVAAAHDWTLSVTESESGGARFEFTGVDG